MLTSPYAPTSITRHAHAKVNLALAVAPPLPAGTARAGWHPICSWMHAVELFDIVRVERAERFAFSARWEDGSPVSWKASSDLCVRAHEVMEARTGHSLPVRIEVTKRIPAGGGLGGGSANAAATMMAINDLFELYLGDDQLRSASKSIGSDVPYFIDPAAPVAPAPAIVSGFGEWIERVPRVRNTLVLVMPPFGCSTPEVYSAYDREFDEGPRPFEEQRVRDLATSSWLDTAELFNDLAEAACRVAPELGELRQRVARAAKGPVHVSGSGSTLFVIDGDADAIAQAAPECNVVRTKLI